MKGDSKKKGKLENAGVNKVKDSIWTNLSPDDITSKLSSISNTSGCSMTTICKIHTQASNTTPGYFPDDIKNLADNNLYKVHYGDSWKEEIKGLDLCKNTAMFTNFSATSTAHCISSHFLMVSLML